MRRLRIQGCVAVMVFTALGGCGWHRDTGASNDLLALKAPARELTKIIEAQGGAAITGESLRPCTDDGPANVFFSVDLADSDFDEFLDGLSQTARHDGWRKSSESVDLVREFDHITYQLTVYAPSASPSDPVTVQARMLDETTCN